MSDLFSSLPITVKILFAIWILVTIANKSKREELIEKLSSLVSTPTVYKEIVNVDIALYPRTSLEIAAQGWKNWFVTPIKEAAESVKSWMQSIQKGMTPEKPHPWKVFNYLIMLLLFVGYFYADAIYVANTLESFGLINQLNEALKRYDIAVLFGSLISVVIGGIIANDVIGKGNFSDWGNKNDSKWIWFAKMFSLFLLFSGMYVIVSLGAARFGRLVTIDENLLLILQKNGQFAINILTPFNAGIATALIADDGFTKGVRVLALIIFSAIFLFLSIIWYIIGAIYGTIIFFIDVIWRIILGLGDILFFITLTPVDEVVNLVQGKLKK